MRMESLNTFDNLYVQYVMRPTCYATEFNG